MDLSKLPKLSDTKGQQTEQQPSADSEPAPVVPVPARGVDYRSSSPYQPPGIGADIWISLIIGILLVYLGGTFAKFLIAKVTHQPFHTGVTWSDTNTPKDGTEVDYFNLEGFTAWSDMGVFFFGLVLLFEAAAKTMLVIRPGKATRVVLLLAVLLTLVALVLNVIACEKMMSVSITPLLSGLAVAFGGYVLFDEWAALSRISRIRPPE